MANKRKNIFLIIYVILVVSVLLLLNGKRKNEYSYKYDLDDFSSYEGTYDETDDVIRIDESFGINDHFADSPGTLLPEGDYKITIHYSSDADNSVHIYSGDNLDNYYTLPAGMSESAIDVSVWPSTDTFTVSLIYNGVGGFEVNGIEISSNKPIYTDYEFLMLLVLVLGISIPLVCRILKNKYNYGLSQMKTAVVLAVYTAAASLPVTLGYMWMGTDTRPHMMRLQGVMKAIEEFRFPTIIYSNYCNRFGELSCIYPDKFLYFPAVLRHFDVSMLMAYNVTLVLINLVAVCVMYFCAKYITSSSFMGIIASGIYCFFPYRMYVMYGGGQAFGMGFAMIFFIILFTAFYDIFFLNGKRWFLLPIGITGFVSSHILSLALAVVLSIITVVFCSIWLFVHGVNIKNQKSSYINIIKSAVITIFLGLSTIVPFVYYFLQGLNIDAMKIRFLESLGNIRSNFLSENGLCYLALFVACVVIGIIYHKKTVGDISSNNGYFGYASFLLLLGFGLFLASTNIFPWKYITKIDFISRGLDFLQFGERFMLAGTAAVCLGFVMILSPLTKKNDNTEKIFSNEKPYLNTEYIKVGLLILIVGVLGVHKYASDINACDSLLSTRITGNIYYKETGYLPPGTEMEWFASTMPICNDWESLENLSYLRNGTNIHYEYKCSSDDVYMEFPVFYYPGYKAYDANGNALEIINSEHNRIQIKLVKSDSNQTVDIKFEEAAVFKICALISLAATILLYLYIICTLKKEK